MAELFSQKGGGPKKRFQYCVEPFHADTILYFRATQGQSGGRHVNFERQRVIAGQFRRAHLLDWKLLRYALNHPIWVDSGWKRRQEREACGVLYGRESKCSSVITVSRITTWHNPELQCTNTFGKVHQNTVYWCSLRVAQSKGLQFCPTTVKRDHRLQQSAFSQKVRENCTAKRINPLLHRKELYPSRT